MLGDGLLAQVTYETLTLPHPTLATPNLCNFK